MGVKRGKFVVLYGNNNVGKSTQMAFLEEKLQKNQIPYKKIKVPVYDLEPTGPVIYAILRGKKPPLPVEEFQQLCAQNRRDYEPTLVNMLESGQLVLAEDYVGTGIAWGVVNGGDLGILEKLNCDLLLPDFAMLLDGPRRIEAKEGGHIYEDGGDWDKSREVHLMLASRYGWKIIDGSRDVKSVANTIWDAVSQFLGVEREVK